MQRRKIRNFCNFGRTFHRKVSWIHWRPYLATTDLLMSITIKDDEGYLNLANNLVAGSKLSLRNIFGLFCPNYKILLCVSNMRSISFRYNPFFHYWADVGQKWCGSGVPGTQLRRARHLIPRIPYSFWSMLSPEKHICAASPPSTTTFNSSKDD